MQLLVVATRGSHRHADDLQGVSDVHLVLVEHPIAFSIDVLKQLDDIGAGHHRLEAGPARQFLAHIDQVGSGGSQQEHGFAILHAFAAEVFQKCRNFSEQDGFGFRVHVWLLWALPRL